jgi:hypothetical protein
LALFFRLQEHLAAYISPGAEVLELGETSCQLLADAFGCVIAAPLTSQAYV